MAVTNLGRVSIVPRGAYDSAVSYKRQDLVTNNGSSYLALTDSVGAPLTDTTRWMLMVDGANVSYQNAQSLNMLQQSQARENIAAAALIDLAEAFDDSKNYTAGQYVTYAGGLWKFVTDHAAGAWNLSHVAIKTIGEELKTLFEDSGTHDMIAPTEASTTASMAHAAGNYFILGGVLYQATADIASGDTIVTSGAGANCKTVPSGLGGGVSELKSALNDYVGAASYPLAFSPTITLGEYISDTNGKNEISTTGKTARTNLLNGFGARIAINMGESAYLYRVCYYTSSGSLTTGEGYLGNTGYINGMHIISEDEYYIGLTFKRADNAVLTNSDVTAIKAALSAYAATDDTLTQKGKAADAKATGDLLQERKQDIQTINVLLYSKNLVSKDMLTDKQCIDATSGAYATSQYYSATEDYIDISAYSRIVYPRIYVTSSSTSAGIAFYDSSKTFIPGSGIKNSTRATEEHVEMYTANIPENAKYARFTYQQFSVLDRFPPFAVYDADAYFNSIAMQADMPGKVGCLSDYISDDHIAWESGYIKADGTNANDTQSIRTVQFLKAPKGSAIYGGIDVSFRVLTYSQPKASAFIERTDAFSRTNKWFYVPYDCYIRVSGNWSPSVVVDSIADLAEQFHIIRKRDKKTIDFFGAKQFYLSEPTAETETNINNKTLSELYAIYDELCTNYPQIIRRLSNIGMDASNTYEIREYEIALKYKLVYEGEVSLSGDLDIEHLTNLWTTNMDNPTIGLQIGIHGNEKAPTWAAALAIKEIVESDDDYATFLKSNFNFRIIPCANPYGFQNDIRRNSNNVDINRNFNDLTQSESVAIANWMYGLVGKACLILAVHGTTGYYAYYSVNGKSPYFDDYCKQCMQFTTVAQNNWAEFYGMDKAPYCYTVKTTYEGTMGELQNKIGIPGFTLETPQNYAHGDQYVWDNDLRSCKLTKDLLINALQNAGEWSALL